MSKVKQVRPTVSAVLHDTMDAWATHLVGCGPLTGSQGVSIPFTRGGDGGVGDVISIPGFIVGGKGGSGEKKMQKRITDMT